MVIDDQMENAVGDKRIVNLFTRGSHHGNLSVIYIVQSLFHQGKNRRSMKSYYLVLFKNPRDKLQILTRLRKCIPATLVSLSSDTIRPCAVCRPLNYLFVGLKTTIQDNRRLRTNVLPGEERFNNVGNQTISLKNCCSISSNRT